METTNHEDGSTATKMPTVINCIPSQYYGLCGSYPALFSISFIFYGKASQSGEFNSGDEI